MQSRTTCDLLSFGVVNGGTRRRRGSYTRECNPSRIGLSTPPLRCAAPDGALAAACEWQGKFDSRCPAIWAESPARQRRGLRTPAGLSVRMVSAEGITPLPGWFNQPARSRAFGQTERLHLFRGDEPLVVVLTTAAFAAGFPPGYPTREVLRRFLPNRAGRPMLRVMRVPCSGMPVGNAATRLPPSCAYWSL